MQALFLSPELTVSKLEMNSHHLNGPLRWAELRPQRQLVDAQLERMHLLRTISGIAILVLASLAVAVTGSVWVVTGVILASTVYLFAQSKFFAALKAQDQLVTRYSDPARVIAKQIPTLPTLDELKKPAALVNSGRASDAEVDRLFGQAPEEIIQRLYLGSQTDVGEIPEKEKERDTIFAEKEKLLNQWGIKRIISCTYTGVSEKNQLWKNFRYSIHGFEDREGNQEFTEKLPEILKEIHLARCHMLPVFIHCNAGQSRSPSVVVAYLMVLGVNMEDAIRYVKSKRVVIDVKNFEEQLKQLNLKDLRAQLRAVEPHHF